MTDLNSEYNAEDALREADRRTIGILESITDAYYELDHEWRFTYLNQQAEKWVLRKREDVLGKIVWDEFPEGVDTGFYRQFHRAVTEQVPVTLEEFYPPLDTWFEVRAYPTSCGLSVYFRDITAIKRTREAESALRESEARLRDAQERLDAALSAGGVATWTWDVATDRVVADSNLARLFSVSPEDAAGGQIAVYIEAIHPDDRLRVAETITDAVARRDVYEAEYRVILPDGSLRWLATRGKVQRNEEGRAVVLPGVVEDITERVEREQRERLLTDLAERTRAMTDPNEVIADAVRSVGQFLGAYRCAFADIDTVADICTVPVDYRADESVVSQVGSFPISAFGEFIAAEFGAGHSIVVDDIHVDAAQAPAETIAAYDALGIRAHITVPVVHSDRLVSIISCHSNIPRHWMPAEVALLRTVVDRTWLTVEVIRQQHAAVREADERRKTHEQNARILESITDAFYAIDRDWRFSYLNAQAARLLFRPREELLGRGIWEEFPEAIGGTFYHLYHRAMNEGESITVEDYYAPLDSWMDVRIYPSEAGLSIFFQNVNERKKAEKERERLLAELRVRAEREALLNRIGEVLRGSPDPEAAQGTAVHLLGEALGADRCYIALYDLSGGTVRILHDWREARLPSIEGKYPFANTAAMFHELYNGVSTSVISDALTSSLSEQTLANMERLQLRSRVSVALADTSGLMATLTAAMSDEARDWTNDEVTLVESVATLLRVGVEAARVQQREHRIAVQLQDALQPAIPQSIGGLTLGSFTRAALEEASVGGDFMDVFALDKELYAIVIADVSGKGLAAAQQIALIRNSLRTTLYLYRAPAPAATALNAIVSAHDLLTGFVTAWVGVYDAATGHIAFCSCGHEPGLVRRANGAVEALETTGLPLGVTEHTEYREGGVTLSSGDCLLLYTDGISESGPNRRELLGTDGLMRMMAALSLDTDIQSQAEALVSDAHAYSNGAFRDDVAVLLSRRQ